MGQEANPAPEHSPTTSENVDELLEAARYDDVISLASSGVPLDSKDSQGRTVVQNGTAILLMFCMVPSSIDVWLTYYLYLGTALHMAAANGHLGIVEYLISRGVAFQNKQINMVYLRTYYTDLCRQDKGLRVVQLSEEVTVIRCYALNEEKNTPLHWACLNGHTEVVKKLILAGANVSILNSQERTPIDEAVSRGKMDVIDTINATMAQVELSGVAVS
ncbi:hypothetical protein EZV62_001014 [Acer yangbiense]|uniref:Uncharacterized protein n=1 Tax=Acer yangbiense TaxID=1000413 RepID=A0A5C7ITA6_9ROSI|nr:hypothetical protein EZV62_001014 [Acer yangbiense]